MPATSVCAHTEVVNCGLHLPNDRSSSPWKPVLMTAQEKSHLLERLTWVCDQKWAGNWSEMSRRCLGETKRTHLTTVKSRLEKKPMGTIDRATAKRIAMASDVDVGWLLDGVGEPAPGVRPVYESDDGDIYPSRAPIVAMAIAEGYSAGAIAAQKAERRAEGDPGQEHWIAQLVHYEKMSRTVAAAKRALNGDDGGADPSRATPRLPPNFRQ